MGNSKIQGSQMKGSKIKGSKIGSREVTQSQMSFPMDENENDLFPAPGESKNPYE